ncbi:beta-galactosidase [Sphaerisporangium viridialbum]|uniref:beta-galactosidase n=1 Tax=Sphaerisporangium viridialbum TaxID=46189 RepID=UPI003C732CF3
MADGEPFGFGNRLHYDPSSPIYRRYAANITTRLAERYSFHPALAMWHINNEYGPTAYNEASSVNFRHRLKRRYGDLGTLNEAWTTRFWSQVYTDWDQIEVPDIPRAWMNPSRILDFKRFTSDALLECYVAERDIVRSFRDDIPVMTNFMRFYRNADYWKWAPEEDVAALDIYPDPARPDSHVSAAFQFDLFRSLKGGQPWMLMEQAASAVSQWKLNVVKEPGRMRLGSLQAMSRGADSVMFFQWRAGRGGQERFHSAMLPHSGPGSRAFGEVTALGREVELLAPVAGTTARAEVAVLLEGRAAVIANAYGSGRVVYFATLLEEAAFDAMLLGQVEAAGVENRFGDVPAHVECSVRQDAQHEYLFLLNHDAERGAAVRLPGGGRDLLTGTPATGEVTLPPLGAVVIQRALQASQAA